MNRSDHPLFPVLVAAFAIGVLSLMDAFMKSASLAVGAYSAMLLRAPIGVALAGSAWRATGARRPPPQVLRLHVLRGIVIAAMGFTFFFALTRLPLAQAIAISFIAPLIALFLAAALLGETLQRATIVGAVLGLIGVIVILAGKIAAETMDAGAPLGLAAVLASALLYAWNLVLQRKQALLAGPFEVATFQNGVVFCALLGFAPFFLHWPDQRAWADIAVSGVLSTLGAMLFAWAYARAEAQRLVPIEYSGFVWASLFGWLFFTEPVTPGTLIGAALIVVGCLIATRRRPAIAVPEQAVA